MRRQAPPLEAAEAFLVAARSVSFRAAADEIALSASAFSRRIQLLEAFVGTALFDRSGVSVRLTEAGARYHAEVAPAMEQIRAATLRLREDGERRVLRVATSHSFAVGWLVARLPALQRRHGIEVELTIGRDTQALRSGEVDLAIWGDLRDNTLCSDHLIALRAVPAYATHLVDGRGPPTSLDRLSEYRAIATKAPAQFWKGWFDAIGYSDRPQMETARYDTIHLTYEAAASGAGLALVVPLLSDRFIADGRLAPLMSIPLPIDAEYRIFFSTPDIPRRPPVRQFLDWLRREANDSTTRFNMWASTCATPLALPRELSPEA
jgi:DNA-binding transcriptional LysR family regulator